MFCCCTEKEEKQALLKDDGNPATPVRSVEQVAHQEHEQGSVSVVRTQSAPVKPMQQPGSSTASVPRPASPIQHEAPPEGRQSSAPKPTTSTSSASVPVSIAATTTSTTTVVVTDPKTTQFATSTGMVDVQTVLDQPMPTVTFLDPTASSKPSTAPTATSSSSSSQPASTNTTAIVSPFSLLSQAHVGEKAAAVPPTSTAVNPFSVTNTVPDVSHSSSPAASSTAVGSATQITTAMVGGGSSSSAGPCSRQSSIPPAKFIFSKGANTSSTSVANPSTAAPAPLSASSSSMFHSHGPVDSDNESEERDERKSNPHQSTIGTTSLEEVEITQIWSDQHFDLFISLLIILAKERNSKQFQDLNAVEKYGTRKAMMDMINWVSNSKASELTEANVKAAIQTYKIPERLRVAILQAYPQQGMGLDPFDLPMTVDTLARAKDFSAIDSTEAFNYTRYLCFFVRSTCRDELGVQGSAQSSSNNPEEEFIAKYKEVSQRFNEESVARARSLRPTKS